MKTENNAAETGSSQNMKSIQQTIYQKNNINERIDKKNLQKVSERLIWRNQRKNVEEKETARKWKVPEAVEERESVMGEMGAVTNSSSTNARSRCFPPFLELPRETKKEKEKKRLDFSFPYLFTLLSLLNLYYNYSNGRI